MSVRGSMSFPRPKGSALFRRALQPLLPLLLLGSSAGAADVVEAVITDALGNVRVITDDQGNILERHDYLPFGEECTTALCASNPGVGAGQPRKFTGKERDQETGLDYFGARYYGSRIGRFTTVDPVYTWQQNLLDPQRWNRYAYARNNPYRYVDPDGKAIFPAIAIAWAVYEVGSQIYDAYTAYQTVSDPNATTGEKATAVGGFAIGAIAPGGGYGAAGKKVLGKLDDLADAKGVVSRQDRLRELADDANVSSADRGWIKGEARQVETGNRATIRNPPGKDLRHPAGRPAAQGHDYSETLLQDRATHRAQHRYLQERSTGTTVRRPATPGKPGPDLPE